MTTSRNAIEVLYHFRGATTPPAAGSPDGGPFVVATTQTGGSPSVAPNLGAMDLTLDNANEAQTAALYMNDELPFDIDEIISVEFWAKIDATPDSATEGGFGLIGAFNATMDSIAQMAIFKFDGDASIVVETDDGTNDNDDVATGLSIGTTWKRFRIELATGVFTQSPPSQSKGGKAAIHFYMGNANGSLQRVATNTNFDMSNYSGGLQLYAFVGKSASTDDVVLSVKDICVTTKQTTPS